MATFTNGLQQSLDGYVDHRSLGPPAPASFRHFLDQMRGLTGCLYGRHTYEIMRYWDKDQPDWDALEHACAAPWRSKPKWVVSSTLIQAGPNPTLIRSNIESALRALKARLVGEVTVAGPSVGAKCGGQVWRAA